MSHGWAFEIYGIEDDKNYLEKIIKSIDGYPKIKLLKPVFGLQSKDYKKCLGKYTDI